MKFPKFHKTVRKFWRSNVEDDPLSKIFEMNKKVYDWAKF